MIDLLYHLMVQPPQSPQLADADTQLIRAIGGNYIRVTFPGGRAMSIVAEYY